MGGQMSTSITRTSSIEAEYLSFIPAIWQYSVAFYLYEPCVPYNCIHVAYPPVQTNPEDTLNYLGGIKYTGDTLNDETGLIRLRCLLSQTYSVSRILDF